MNLVSCLRQRHLVPLHAIIFFTMEKDVILTELLLQIDPMSFNSDFKIKFPLLTLTKSTSRIGKLRTTLLQSAKSKIYRFEQIQYNSKF